MDAARASGIGSWVAGAGLVSVAAVAALVRLAGLESVLRPDGTVVFPMGDALYHARLTLAAWTRFPDALRFDAYLNHPGGATVPWPPLFDLTLAGVARLTGGGEAGVERVLALSGPAFGALATVAVYVAARRVGGRGLALGAAGIYALLPASIDAGHVGNCDHHAAVSLLGACLLALCLTTLDLRVGPRRWWTLAVGLALGRTAMLFTWPGSLLFFLLIDATIFVGFSATGRRDVLRVGGASALLPAALGAVWVAMGPMPLGGWWSSIAVSWLHVLWCLGAAGAAGALLLLERSRPAKRFASRALRTVVACTIVGAGLLLLPGVLPGLELAARFLTLTDVTGTDTAELAPLYRLGSRAPLAPAGTFFAGFASLVPLAPVAAAWAARAPERRAPALVLAGWTALLAALTVMQVRYANELAAPLAISFALGLAAVGSLVAVPFRGSAGAVRAVAAAAVAILLGVALLAPALRVDWAALAQTLRAQGDGGAASRAHAPAPDTPAAGYATLRQFGEMVRAATPETRSYFREEGAPEWGILSNPNLGHALRYYAHRPVTIDSFFAYLSPERYGRVQAFFLAAREPDAFAIAGELGARYVVTWADPRSAQGSLLARLQDGDGRATAADPRLEHFRLVTEGPPGGRPLGTILRVPTPKDAIPYKLFEIVPGAVLEASAPPGTEVEARVVVRSPLGRVFGYAAEGTSGADGLARLVVPYATETGAPVRPDGGWRVRVGDREVTVAVTDADVTEGRTVRVGERAEVPRAAE